MKFDLIDIEILREFYKLKKNDIVTTWTIMNRVFSTCKNDSEKRAKHNLIKNRLRKMQGDLFEIKKNGDGKLIYTLIGENIKFCKYKFPTGSKECLMICLDKKWNAFEL